MIRSLYRAHDGRIHTGLTPDELTAALQDVGGLLWVDLVEEPPQVCEPILLQTFGFHHLAVDNALEESHVPKADDWGQYVYLVLQSVLFDPQAEELVATRELDIFLGHNYLVTHQHRSIPAVDRVWTACGRDERHLQRGVGNLLYQLADELVSDALPVVEQIDDEINQIEDEIFDHPGPTLVQHIFTLKRAVLHLRRTLAPQREVFNKLARGDYEVVDEGCRMFFRDVYDHLVRLFDITESLRDLIGGALDTYLSVVNNRMNEVMKTLTVITTLFMPISFLTGFFGMNFFQPATPLAAWTGRPAFIVMLVVTALVPFGMLLWMRRRAWM